MKNQRSDTEILSSFIDGELEEGQMREVEERLARDQSFKDLFERLCQLNSSYVETISRIDNIPLSSNIERVLHGPAYDHHSQLALGNVFSIANARYLKTKPGYLPQYATAAALILAVSVFFSFAPEKSEETGASQFVLKPDEPVPLPVSIALGDMVAGDELQIADDVSLAEVLAFNRKDGVFCKHYLVEESRKTTHAVACYENARWINVAIDYTAAQAHNANFFIPATGEQAPRIDAYIQESIHGASLANPEEREIMKGIEPD